MPQPEPDFIARFDGFDAYEFMFHLRVNAIAALGDVDGVRFDEFFRAELASRDVVLLAAEDSVRVLIDFCKQLGIEEAASEF